MNEDIHYPEVLELDISINYLIRSSRKDITIYLKLYYLCKIFRPDIIHTWDSMTSFYSLPIAKLFKIKLINGSIRNATPSKVFSIPWFIAKLTFPLYDKIISNSYAALKVNKISKHKSFCIHNGFDFDRTLNIINKKIIRHQLGITTKHVVGMVASFTEKKDYETFFKTASEILFERQDITFIAIGDGPTYSSFKKKYKPIDKGKILFLGRINNVEKIINIFDIGVLLTNRNVHEESISNSIMEYMALGKPVIATKGGGTVELVTDGVTGFLVNNPSPQEMAEKILFLLDNEDLADKMGKAGNKRIETKFSIDQMINSYLELYNRILLS